MLARIVFSQWGAVVRISLFLASLLLICTNVFADQKGPNLERHIDPVARSGMTSGNLDGSATFDRQFLVTYDGSCSAASSDSSNDGVSYQTFKVMSPSGQNMQAEVLLARSLTRYCLSTARRSIR